MLYQQGTSSSEEWDRKNICVLKRNISSNKVLLLNTLVECRAYGFNISLKLKCLVEYKDHTVKRDYDCSCKILVNVNKIRVKECIFNFLVVI